MGNLHQYLGTLPYRSLQAMADKLGPIMLLQLGQVPALVVSSVDMAREIMKTQNHIFASRPSLKVFTALLYDGRDVVFAPDGEYWRQTRKMCVFHLLSPKMVQSCKLIGEEEVAFMIEAISRSHSSGFVWCWNGDHVCGLGMGLADHIRNPQATKRLKDEIRGIVGSKPMVKEENLNEMSYLKAVIKESMRLHPPGSFLVPRELTEDTRITGYVIPKGTRIFVNV